jgi:predicted dienelactone hydrolase
MTASFICNPPSKGPPMNHLNLNRHRLGAAICGLAVFASAGLFTTRSASAQSSTTAAESATTSAKSASRTPPLTDAPRGGHAVGYRVFSTTGAQNQPLTLRAWYPARPPADGKRPTITYTAPSKFGEEILALNEINSVGSAISNGKPKRAAKPYPLVVFSHGFAISPIVFSTLVEHYASHGYVVLAPEHNETFDQSLDGFWKAIVDRPVDITRTIDYAEQLTKPKAAFAGMIDVKNIAVVGHSYGGYTALAAAGARFDFAAYKTRCAALSADDPLNFFCGPVLPKEADIAARAGLPSVPSGLWPSLGDARVKSVISMAGDAYQFDQRGLAEIKVPIMVMGGTIDEGTPYTWGAKLTYDHVASKNKTLVTFNGAGHNLFVDPCDSLPWVETFSYRDGFCLDAVWGARRPLGIVAHYSTAFLRETLNADRSARASLTRKQRPISTVEYVTTR